MDELQVIKARYKLINRGWVVNKTGFSTSGRADGPFLFDVRRDDGSPLTVPIHKDEAYFIAHAIEDVPALVREVEQLRHALEMIEAQRNAISDKKLADIFERERIAIAAALKGPERE